MESRQLGFELRLGGGVSLERLFACNELGAKLGDSARELACPAALLQILVPCAQSTRPRAASPPLRNSPQSRRSASSRFGLGISLDQLLRAARLGAARRAPRLACFEPCLAQQILCPLCPARSSSSASPDTEMVIRLRSTLAKVVDFSLERRPMAPAAQPGLGGVRQRYLAPPVRLEDRGKTDSARRDQCVLSGPPASSARAARSCHSRFARVRFCLHADIVEAQTLVPS